jgi:hypothetical protein
MQKLVVLLLVLISSMGILAQSKARKFVVWNPDKACALTSRSLRGDNTLECSVQETPRGPVSSVSHGGMSLSVAFIEEDGYLMAAVMVQNRNAEPLDIDTDHWGAAHFAKHEDFTSGVKPIHAETSIPSRDLVRGIKSGIGIDNSTDTFMASITKSVEVRERPRPDGRRQREVNIVDDAEAKDLAGARSTSRAEAAEAAQAKFRRNAVTQKWVPAGDKIKGLVYFKRIKKARLVVFSFDIQDTAYIFRLSRGQKKKA